MSWDEWSGGKGRTRAGECSPTCGRQAGPGSRQRRRWCGPDRHAGAAAARAAGAQARSGTVTNDKFAVTAVSVLSAPDAWAVGDSAEGVDLLHWYGRSW